MDPSLPLHGRMVSSTNSAPTTARKGVRKQSSEPLRFASGVLMRAGACVVEPLLFLVPLASRLARPVGGEAAGSSLAYAQARVLAQDGGGG